MGWFLALLTIAICVVIAVVAHRREKQRKIERDFEEFLKKNMDLSKFHILYKGDEVVFVEANPKQYGKRIHRVIFDESEGTTNEKL